MYEGGNIAMEGKGEVGNGGGMGGPFALNGLKGVFGNGGNGAFAYPVFVGNGCTFVCIPCG